MTDPAKQLQMYRTRGVVVDSNLLLLLFIGSYERSKIRTSSRLAQFSEDDYEILLRVLEPFRLIVTTPNILTEVSNLSGGIPEGEKEAYFTAFAARLSLLDEQHVGSAAALTNRWAKFGLTDAVIATIAKNKYLVLTDDFRLSQSLNADGIHALNFNHLRDICWQLSS